MSNHNKLETLYKKKDMILIQNLRNTEYHRLPEHLKKNILLGSNLSRPDPYRRFYIKTDWSKDGMGVVILQADISAESRKSEAQEKDGGN